MSGQAETTRVSAPDRPLVLYDLLEEMAALQAEGVDPVEVELLVEEFRRLRAEL